MESGEELENCILGNYKVKMTGKSLETAKAMITFLQTLIWQCNSNVQKLMEAGGHAILQNWRENTVHRQDRQIVSRAEYILERIQPEGYS